MNKITFIGMETEKERFLQRLQDIGVTHLIHPYEPIEAQDIAKELARVTETRKFLASRAAGEKPEKPLSSREICEKREILAQRESRLQAEMLSLRKEIALQEAWGEFKVEDLDALRQRGVHIHFYKVSQKAFDSLPLGDVYHQVISVHRGEICFVTLSVEPSPLNIPEDKIASRSLSTLEGELNLKREELKEIEGEYVRLAAHLDAIMKSEAELTDLLAYHRAILNAGTELEGLLFVVRCWSPIPASELVNKIGADFTLYHYSEEPTDEDRVPVLMHNPPALDSGEDLVRVYSHPSYQDFDPSGLVLYCFAVFFGMIVGDAGYGFSLLAVTFLLHRKFKSDSPFAVRFFRLMYLLGASTFVYGILSAGYFGISLSPENPLARFSLLDYNSQEGQNQVMILSILIGMIHISLSLIIRFKKTRDLAALGWVPVIWGGYFLVSSQMGKGVDNPPARYVLIFGLVVVFLFSSNRKNILLRLLEGLNGLLGIVQIFSDVLSYLRLFALGIATVYMAQTFNMLADDIVKGIPYLGYIFAVLILVSGHLVNLMLAIMGGVIHGLRLNFLEWYRWCFVGDGLVYKPFRIIKSRE
ncbi:MAG: hypothetical protein JXL84_12025 [Deltaproteobacteria bacterium]|nr:hypothetical protein [Deltaproteobacteria bacterium]